MYYNITIRPKDIATLHGNSERTARKELNIMLDILNISKKKRQFRNYVTLYEYCDLCCITMEQFTKEIEFHEHLRQKWIKQQKSEKIAV